MAYVIERKGVKERKRAPEFAKNLSEINREIGNRDIEIGDAYVVSGDYRRASKAYRHAASFYGEASRDPKLDEDGKKLLVDLHDGAMEKYRALIHKAALDKSTKHMNPLKRWIVRHTRAENVVGFFILSILFSSPSITGAAIGSNGFVSYLGIILFFFGIVGCYFLFWKKHLVSRFQDQY